MGGDGSNQLDRSRLKIHRRRFSELDQAKIWTRTHWKIQFNWKFLLQPENRSGIFWSKMVKKTALIGKSPSIYRAFWDEIRDNYPDFCLKSRCVANKGVTLKKSRRNQYWAPQMILSRFSSKLLNAKRASILLQRNLSNSDPTTRFVWTRCVQNR